MTSDNFSNGNTEIRNKLLLKTKALGIQVILLSDELPNKPSGWAISRQIIRSATSVGANYRSVCKAKSNADFINKLKIVEEECDETIYWLEVALETKLLSENKIRKLLYEATEILAIIIKSLKTMRAKQPQSILKL